jgi:hypothetical protein
MIVAVFTALFLTFVFGWMGWRALAGLALLVCLGAYVWEFQYEIYSPEYGFRMPWIQVELAPGLDSPPGGAT